MSKRSKSVLKTAIIIALANIIFGSGCVYYNTFFLAKKNYRFAEKTRLRSTTDALPSDAVTKYEIAIKKSSKVLSFYQESKYIDDALFLLGMCFYRTGEYAKAVRKFDELLEAFPKSDYVDEADYWRTLSIYELGDFDDALDRLRELAQSGDYAERSIFMIAELFYQQEDYISAKDAFEDYLYAFPSGRYSSLVHYRLATIEFVQESYKVCIEQARMMFAKEITPAEFFGSRMLIGEAFTELDSLNTALIHYEHLRKNEDFYTRWPEVDLRIGDVYYLLEDTTSAIAVWSGVCIDFPRTENSAWGWFKRGDLHLSFGEITVAKAEFDSAAAQVGSGKVKELALQKSASIAKLQEFKDILQSDNDSIDVDIVATEMALAEMYLLELEQPDSALSEYNYILKNYPDDSLAPKASYGIGWVYAYKTQERSKADSAFASLLKQYPESDYAVGAVDYFVGRGAALDSLGVETVAYYFIKAEEFLLTYNRTDSALAYYGFVADSFAQSQFRPKALTAMAYIHETITFNYSVAESIYTFIADSFPDTEIAHLAQVRLGKAAPKIERERAPEMLDSSGFADEDTAEVKDEYTEGPKRNELRSVHGGIIDPVTGKEIPRAPRPRYPVELRYPQAEWKSKLQGRVVRLKIRIDPFGEVDEVELMATCGSDVIDNAAIAGVKETEWNPEEIPIEHIGDWFYFEVRVNKPTETLERSH